MAPEMLLSNQFDSRIDVYALGLIFLEMMTGKLIVNLLEGR